jgi:hypothetical protein
VQAELILPEGLLNETVLSKRTIQLRKHGENVNFQNDHLSPTEKN